MEKPRDSLARHEDEFMLTNNLSGQVWENGDFSIGLLTKLVNLEPYTDVRSPEELEEAEWRLNLAKVHGYEAAKEFLESLQSQDEEPEAEVSPLGLSNAINSHKKKKRGEAGITTYGRRMVKNAAFRLQTESPKRLLSFLTLTLPDVSEHEALVISQHWSDILRVFLQRLSRRLKQLDLPGEVVGVTEIQMKRLISTGVFALHYHCVFKGRKMNQGWALTPQEVREWWKECLSKYLVEHLNVYNWDACENIQQVKKDASGYLGKYMSKGIGDLQHDATKGCIEYFPSSWWNCSSSLKNRVSNNIKSMGGDRGRLLFDLCSCHEIADCFKFIQPVVLKFIDGHQIVVGWYGQLNDFGLNLLFPERTNESV